MSGNVTRLTLHPLRCPACQGFVVERILRERENRWLFQQLLTRTAQRLDLR